MQGNNRMLTRKEYMEKAGPFGFCLHPIDVSLVRMQQKMLQQVAPWEEEREYAITEHWVSRNPEMSISKVSVTALQTKECCKVIVRVTDKQLRYIATRPVWIGTLSDMKKMLDSDKFLTYCKRELLWLNYALENHTDENDLLEAGWQQSGDLLPDFMDYVKEQLSRLLTEWDEVVPLHGSFTPVFDFFANPDPGSEDTVGAYGLKVYKMPDDIVADADMRYLEAAVYDPARAYKIDMVVASGHSNDLKERLATADFSQKLYDDYAKLLDLWEEA